MKTRFSLLVCAAVLWLSGCASTPPPAPVVPAIPAQWQAALPHHGSVTDLSHWWQQLGDPVLPRLLAAAQAASPTLASALSRVAQSRAARTQARAALLPALDGNASGVRGVSQPQLPVATSLAATLQASWEIDLFGANRLAADAAQARLESAQAQWHDARVSVAAETARLYFEQRACERQWDIARSDADSRAQTSRLAALSMRAGFTPPATAALARASAAEARNRATQRRALCDIDVKGLVALTGLDEAALREQLAGAPRDLAGGAWMAIDAVPAQVLNQRPDLLAAQRDVAAASAALGSAQAQRYPSLSLSGAIGLQHFRSAAGNDDLTTWSIGPLALSVPLFDGGRRSANVQSAEARYDEAAFLYQARVRQAVREVEEALVRLQSTAARDEDAAQADEGYRASLAATEARYQAGLASLVELEEARRSALASSDALVGLQLERIEAWLALYRAAGGGFHPAQLADAR